jgi:DNA-directed RNA polymerase subunit D
MAFRIIDENDDKAVVQYFTEDIKEVNLLRRSILSEIKTWAIDIVKIHINTSSRHDEILALRLGQLPIIQSEITEKEIRIDFTADTDFKTFTTRDIDLPFKNEIPILVLKKGQRILCDVILVKNNAKTHVKWRPVSTVYFEKNPDGGYNIFIEKIGMMDASEIIEKGIKKMKNASKFVTENIFFKPLIPTKFLEEEDQK